MTKTTLKQAESQERKATQTAIMSEKKSIRAINRNSTISIGLAITLVGVSVMIERRISANTNHIQSIIDKMNNITLVVRGLSTKSEMRAWSTRLKDLNPDLNVPPITEDTTIVLNLVPLKQFEAENNTDLEDLLGPVNE